MGLFCTSTTTNLCNLTPYIMATSMIKSNADYIVEQGTSGIWTYRKWSGGTAECWGEWSSGSFAPDGQTAGWYRKILSSISFPTDLFIEKPNAFFNLTYWGNGYYWGTIRALTESTYQLQLFRNDNASSTAKGNIYAIGKWK